MNVTDLLPFCPFFIFFIFFVLFYLLKSKNNTSFYRNVYAISCAVLAETSEILPKFTIMSRPTRAFFGSSSTDAGWPDKMPETWQPIAVLSSEQQNNISWNKRFVL